MICATLASRIFATRVTTGTDTSFPQPPYFVGLNQPVGMEIDGQDRDGTGMIPAEAHGSFYCVVPDPAGQL